MDRFTFLAIGRGLLDAMLPVLTVQELGWTDGSYSKMFAIDSFYRLRFQLRRRLSFIPVCQLVTSRSTLLADSGTMNVTAERGLSSSFPVQSADNPLQ